jgi:uncharacterized protein
VATLQPPGIDAKVAFLSRPDTWPARPDRVEVVETHFSWVFLTGAEVYKLKKPIRFAQLDLRALADRRTACETELRLNRRLAPSVYVAVVPVVLTDRGDLRVGGSGDAVDWLVRMVQLPKDLFLDQQIADQRVDEGRLRSAVALLAALHLGSRPVERDVGRCLARFADQRVQAVERLRCPGARVSADAVDRLDEVLRRWLAHRQDLVAARVEAGRIVDGHGDLRPEHVALLPEPVIIDCLDFDPALRHLDAVDELAYLALECERLAAPELGSSILATWSEIAADEPPSALVAFYQAHRALVRASLAALRLVIDHAPNRDAERWRIKMGSYLDAALARVPMLETGGLP